MRDLRHRSGTALFLGFGLLAESAYAEDTKVRIEYAAPSECPDEQTFLRQVKERTRRARFAEPNEIARTLRVTVKVEAPKSVARVEFTDADSRQVVREVGGETCDEVVKGIALITALAIEARAGEEASGTVPSPRTSEAPRPASNAEPAPAPAAERPRSRPTEATGLGWDVGIGFYGTSGAAPELVFGLGAFAGVHPQRPSWSARASFIHAESSTVKHAGGEARFRLTLGRGEFCPVRFLASKELAVMPCTAIDAGALVGSGKKSGLVVEPSSATEFWLAASALARLELALGEFLLVETQAELGFPLVRERFVFEFNPVTTIHEIPVVKFGFGVAVGFRFH